MENDKLDLIVNPYEFSHPVRDRSRFFGRDKILKDIEYYLDQAKGSGNPINLALIGPRASGKTSLLNMIGWEAEDRGFCVVDVPLNEDDAKSDVSFFYKSIDAIFNAALQMRPNPETGDIAFGGEWGQTHSAYLKLTSQSSSSVEFRECPIRFAHFYSHMRAADLRETPVNDSIIRQDLKLISTEVGRPIVILLDEANVLSTRHTLLQKIRNIFQSISGFMLVIAGTEALFPSLDDVYSPIARDFKRIEVGPFQSAEEAQSCILEPLELLGLSPAEDHISPETLSELSEIDGFTGGSPYQIQLACHFLFREMQDLGTSRMRLTIDTLNAVISELSIGPSSILTELRALTLDLLRDLSKLLQGLPEESLESRLCARRVLLGDSAAEIERLRVRFNHFRELGIIKGSQDAFDFGGDEREFLYLKYYARARGVRESINILPASIRGLIYLSAEIHETSGWSPLRRMYFTSLANVDEVTPDIFSLLQTLTRIRTADVEDIHSNMASPSMSDAAVDLLIESISDDYTELRVGTLVVYTPYFSHETLFTNLGADKLRDETMDRILNQVRSRMDGIDASIEFHSQLFTLDNSKAILQNISHLASIGYVEPSALLDLAVMEYFNDSNSPKFKTIVDLLEVCEDAFQGDELNNLAYLLMAQSEWKRAGSLLVRAREHAESQELVNYNLSVCLLMIGDLNGAKHFVEESLAVMSEKSRDWNDEVACLFVPIESDEGFVVEEKDSPHLAQETQYLSDLLI